MANWLNPDDYPFSSKRTSLREWAWEFLRRNPEYRQDYANFIARVSDLEKKFGQDWKQQDSARENIPPKKPGESCKAWRFRCDVEGEKAQSLPLEQWYAQKWGLRERMGDPDQGITDYIIFITTSDFPRRIEILDHAHDLFQDQPIGEDSSGGEELFIRDGLALIAFDLRIPVKKQITKAAKLLKAAKKRDGVKVKSVHKAKDKWAIYLRVLDGLAAGIGNAEIAKTLGYAPVSHSTVTAPMKGYDWVKAATQIRDHDYRYIVSENLSSEK